MCVRVCVCRCMCVVLVCNYRFVIEYVSNHANANVECQGVRFGMTMFICDYNYRVMLEEAGMLCGNVCVCMRVCVCVCVFFAN